MSAKHLVFAAACFVLALTQVSGQDLKVDNGKIKVTVGTASGSIDTANFIRDELAETYRLYGDFLEIEFVPWGRTQWNGPNGDIICQYGPNDCWANRLHRCVLNMLKDKPAAQVHYMTCEFTSPFPSFLQGSYVCAQAVGVNLIEVDSCVAHPGDDLGREAQVAATEPVATINFVPYIMFFGVPDRSLHDRAMAGFRNLICSALASDPSTGVTNC